jgi:hypothetical protein
LTSPEQPLTIPRTCATGALRIHYAHRVYYYTKLNPSPTYDISWEALGSWVSTSLEANLAVICASAPALKVYWGPWLSSGEYEPRTFGWYARGHHAQSMPVNSDSGYASGRVSTRVTPKNGSANVSAEYRADGAWRAGSPEIIHIEHREQ